MPIQTTNRNRIIDHIAGGDNFRIRSMSGQRKATSIMPLVGRLPAEWHESVRQADYIVYSYDTPIAWRTGDEWTVPDVSYSPTTAGHQTIVRMAVRP